MTTGDFESFEFVENPTPYGGTIKISVGCLLFDGDETEHAATYFEIKDKNKNIVTQFASNCYTICFMSRKLWCISKYS